MECDFLHNLLYINAHCDNAKGKRKRATQGEREICFPHAVLISLYTHCWDITYGYRVVTVSETLVILANEVAPTFLICAVDGEITTANKSPPGLLAT